MEKTHEDLTIGETNMPYEIKPLTEEEEALVEKKIIAYADAIAPLEPRTEEEQLIFRIADEKGRVLIQAAREKYPGLHPEKQHRSKAVSGVARRQGRRRDHRQGARSVLC
ncbi:MAG: hypothetical protein IKQ41_07845 [Clostridia bacterium]|nr:hypothetical protein [Clostridia bacterium]